MHVYQMRSSNQSIVSATQQRLTICMHALRDISKVWLVAKMVQTLFESILGNKVMEERLQKAAGRRHTKVKPKPPNTNGSRLKDPPQAAELANEAQKRKFEDIELGYSNAPPAAQMSYERSRPQSPAVTPGRENNSQPPSNQQQNPQQQTMPQITATSPPSHSQRHPADPYLGRNTRPTTPFNFSYPGTPPDLFLHTRNSPKISDDLWQNYGPEQLFPPEASGMFPLQSPTQAMVDPALRAPAPHPPQQQHQQQQTPTSFPPQQMPPQTAPLNTIQEAAQQRAGMGMNYQQNPEWAHLHALQGQQQPQQARSEDQWSNSSSLGPSVPTTLNVGDWFEFFGIPNNGGEFTGVGGMSGGYA